MTIHGLTVCVDYADMLGVGVDRWLDGLDSLIVVTRPGDRDTAALVSVRQKARLYATTAFYEDGAAFNKGRAIEEGRKLVPWTDWVLFFDADVVPPVGWKSVVENASPKPGCLWGASRVQCRSTKDVDRTGLRPMRYDVPGVGFFQLFHSQDPALVGEPLIETQWTHAGNYDNGFMRRWKRVRELPLVLWHVGQREEWFGRGNRGAFVEMQAERRRRGGRWDHETIEPEVEDGIQDDGGCGYRIDRDAVDGAADHSLARHREQDDDPVPVSERPVG
jgi:hypothetical protein